MSRIPVALAFIVDQSMLALEPRHLRPNQSNQACKQQRRINK